MPQSHTANNPQHAEEEAKDTIRHLTPRRQHDDPGTQITHLSPDSGRDNV